MPTVPQIILRKANVFARNLDSTCGFTCYTPDSTEGANFALFLTFLGRGYPTVRENLIIKGGCTPRSYTLDYQITGTTKEIGLVKI
jgi:hypothetical protein